MVMIWRSPRGPNAATSSAFKAIKEESAGPGSQQTPPGQCARWAWTVRMIPHAAHGTSPTRTASNMSSGRPSVVLSAYRAIPSAVSEPNSRYGADGRVWLVCDGAGWGPKAVKRGGSKAPQGTDATHGTAR
jgi:hypothetical protein